VRSKYARMVSIVTLSKALAMVCRRNLTVNLFFRLKKRLAADHTSSIAFNSGWHLGKNRQPQWSSASNSSTSVRCSRKSGCAAKTAAIAALSISCRYRPRSVSSSCMLRISPSEFISGCSTFTFTPSRFS
jgi:hypothetical protein